MSSQTEKLTVSRKLRIDPHWDNPCEIYLKSLEHQGENSTSFQGEREKRERKWMSNNKIPQMKSTSHAKESEWWDTSQRPRNRKLEHIGAMATKFWRKPKFPIKNFIPKYAINECEARIKKFSDVWGPPNFNLSLMLLKKLLVDVFP